MNTTIRETENSCRTTVLEWLRGDIVICPFKMCMIKKFVRVTEESSDNLEEYDQQVNAVSHFLSVWCSSSLSEKVHYCYTSITILLILIDTVTCSFFISDVVKNTLIRHYFQNQYKSLQFQELKGTDRGPGFSLVGGTRGSPHELYVPPHNSCVPLEIYIFFQSLHDKG